MFGILTLCLRLCIYLGALLTVVFGVLIGPEIIAELGFTDVPAGIAYGIGAAIGVFSASILFGMPIVLLEINAKLGQAVDLLKTMQPSVRSGMMEAVAPVFVDHALDALKSD